MRIRLVGLVSVLGGCIAIILLIGKQLPSELAPMEDRNRVRTSITGPEGADFDFTDKVSYEITQQLLDSIPEKNVVLTFAPGFQRQRWKQCSICKYGFGKCIRKKKITG
jgi:multidrug efflux pump